MAKKKTSRTTAKIPVSTGLIQSVEIIPGLSKDSVVEARAEARKTAGFVEAKTFRTKDGARSLIVRYEHRSLPKSARGVAGAAVAVSNLLGAIEYYTGVHTSELPAVRAMIRADGGAVVAEYPDGADTYTVVARYP